MNFEKRSPHAAMGAIAFCYGLVAVKSG